MQSDTVIKKIRNKVEEEISEKRKGRKGTGEGDKY